MKGCSISERTGDVRAGAGGVAGVFESPFAASARSPTSGCAASPWTRLSRTGGRQAEAHSAKRQHKTAAPSENVSKQNPRMTAAYAVFTTSHWVNYRIRH